MKKSTMHDRFYYFKIALWAIMIIFFLGCGENAKGKANENPKGVVNTGGNKIKSDKPNLMLPDFSLSDLDGKQYRLADYVGKKPVLLVFWTTGCHFCVKEIPALNELFVKDRDNLELLSIDIYEPTSMVRSMVENKGIKYPVLLDKNGDTARAYRVRGVPTFVVIGIDGGMLYYGPELSQATKKIGLS